MTTSTPTKPTPTAKGDQPEAQEITTQPAPAGQLAVIFTPELGEACLQSCRGGSLSWAFGPLSNPTTLRINPGLNAPVSRELWEKAKEQADTQVLMGRNLIQEIELADGATTPDGQLSIAAVSIPVAIRMIMSCRDTEQLERWLVKEDRQQLRKELGERIQGIKEGKP
jgi:hypothetical protein